MKFAPLKEEEVKSYSLLPAGVYPFEVVEAEDKVSKSGNDMIQLKLKVWDNDGNERVVYDYLLEALSYKLRHFSAYTGLLSKYEAGELKALDCLGKCGSANISVQQGQQNPMGGYYPDKNSIKDYVSPVIKPNAKLEKEFEDDALPF